MNKGHSVSANLMAMSGRRYTSDWDTYYNEEKKEYYNEPLERIILFSLKYTLRHRFRRCTIGVDIDVINVFNQKIIIDREPEEDGFIERRLDGILPIIGIWVAI